jgi:hypothetical protein
LSPETTVSALIVLIGPVSQANIAKVVATSAGHVIASFVLFDEQLAVRTAFPIFKIGLKVNITGSYMLGELALLAKLHFALLALKGSMRNIDHSFAFFSGT